MYNLTSQTPGPDYPPEKKDPSIDKPEVKPQGIPAECPPARTDKDLQKEERKEIDNPNPVPGRPEASNYISSMALFAIRPSDHLTSRLFL